MNPPPSPSGGGSGGRSRAPAACPGGPRPPRPGPAPPRGAPRRLRDSPSAQGLPGAVVGGRRRRVAPSARQSARPPSVCGAMAARSLRRFGTVLSVGGAPRRGSLYFRGSPCVFSTAAQQRSTGDECGPEDPRDEPKHPLSDCALQHKAIKLEEQVRDLTERYRKALADSENVRRRTQKFVEDAKLFGIQSFCRDLVEVADILEKTAESAAEEAEPSNPNPTLKKIYEGLSLIEAKLQSVFAKHGLQKMNPVGGKYDPYDHEIVCHVPAEGVQPGTIALVTQDGYKLHGRTIRHALVGVAVESQE
ncbi:grpE protein homolog 2, mitochondrial [Strix uralensis]|uniref:grpE protein homolog 2, mitochondrial n=1 Tax=Strix uralensis TaxID=36305 RepID=UPI003DA33AA3